MRGETDDRAREGVHIGRVAATPPITGMRATWVIVREKEHDDVSWVWVERAKRSANYANNGGLFEGVGPPSVPPPRKPGESDHSYANRLLGWEQMECYPHSKSDEWAHAVWAGAITDDEPDIFPAWRIDNAWYVIPIVRKDMSPLEGAPEFGDCPPAFQ